jgi:multidrug efflux pump subunit AcrA (membrane-fusion protein)
MPQHRLTASVLLSGVIVAASYLVIAPTAYGQTPNGPVSAVGRIEGGSDVLSLGTSATGTIAQLLVKAGDQKRASIFYRWIVEPSKPRKRPGSQISLRQKRHSPV